jgi:hypothetical protein
MHHIAYARMRWQLQLISDITHTLQNLVGLKEAIG